MKWIIIGLTGLTLGGCTMERISPEGLTLERPYTLPARDVKVFASFDEIQGRHEIVDDVWIRDNQDLSPEEMEKQLRIQAGARGANAVVMSRYNRNINGTRIILNARSDNPFEYFQGTAIWVGDGERPVKILGGERDQRHDAVGKED